MIRPLASQTHVLMERMTRSEIATHIQAGHRNVIVSSGSIEQHGPHLPLDTDYILARELATRTATRLGHTLVAPIIPIGCADHHMAFPGTLSVPRDVFIAYVQHTAKSLIAHGFTRLLFASFHGGNFAPSLEAAERIKADHPMVDVRTALDLNALFQVTNGVIKDFFPDRTALDCHAGCVETSMMYYLDPRNVREEEVVDGAVFTEIPPMHDMRAITQTGILGLVHGYSPEIGERLFNRLIAFMIRSWG